MSLFILLSNDPSFYTLLLDMPIAVAIAIQTVHFFNHYAENELLASEFNTLKTLFQAPSS